MKRRNVEHIMRRKTDQSEHQEMTQMTELADKNIKIVITVSEI